MKKRFFPWVCGIVPALLVLALSACGGSDSGPVAPVVELTLTKSSITVNGIAREYYVYAPSNLADLREQDARQVPIVFSFHDQGQTGEDNAKATRWHEVAEAKGFVVAFPSAVGGKWNTTQSSAAADDVAFVKAVWTAFQQASGTNAFNLSSGNPVYLTGIGMGAAMAQQMAMIGANLGTIQVISAVAGIRGTADGAIYNLPEGATPAGASLPVSTMSAWVIRDNAVWTSGELSQIAYWNKQNAVAASPRVSSDDSFDTFSYTSATNPLQETRVSTFKTTALSGKALSEKIWNEMFSKVLRFLDDTRINGSLHSWESIAEMGLTESSKEFSTAAGGKQRWLIYLPSNYAALTAGGKKIPLVFSLHGRKGSARWQAMMTQWHKVAEKKGFIMAYPQGPLATWDAGISKGASTPNTNVRYFLELLDELKSRYAVDATRVYLNGTSMGALFANRMAVQYPELFAAIAPCYSGHLSSDVYINYQQYPDVKTDVPIPVWQCRGGDEPFTAFPGGAKGEEEARTFWRVTVNKSPATAPPTTRPYDQISPVSASNPNVTKVWEDTVPATTTQVIGRKTIKIFADGLADYRWQVTSYVPHFWPLTDQAEQMWDEMFSRYVRNADKTLTKN